MGTALSLPSSSRRCSLLRSSFSMRRLSAGSSLTSRVFSACIAAGCRSRGYVTPTTYDDNCTRLRSSLDLPQQTSECQVQARPVVRSALMIKVPPLDSFALLLGLSFFLGLAFEDFFNRGTIKRPGGIRTFPMLALGGGILYLFDPAHLDRK